MIPIECKNCGKKDCIEEVRKNCKVTFIINMLSDTTKQSTNPVVIDDGVIDCFRCYRCRTILTDDNFEIINTTEGLAVYLKTNYKNNKKKLTKPKTC